MELFNFDDSFVAGWGGIGWKVCGNLGFEKVSCSIMKGTRDFAQMMWRNW